jgi:hypothetical protein
MKRQRCWAWSKMCCAVFASFTPRITIRKEYNYNNEQSQCRTCRCGGTPSIHHAINHLSDHTIEMPPYELQALNSKPQTISGLTAEVCAYKCHQQRQTEQQRHAHLSVDSHFKMSKWLSLRIAARGGLPKFKITLTASATVHQRLHRKNFSGQALAKWSHNLISRS